MSDFNLPKPRLALLLEHFAAIVDVREPWRVVHPLHQAGAGAQTAAKIPTAQLSRANPRRADLPHPAPIISST
jgi:hypothetical protein